VTTGTLGTRGPQSPAVPAKRGAVRLPAVWEPALLVPLVTGSSSVASLLLYFYGIAAMGAAVKTLLIPSVGLLVAFTAWARATARLSVVQRVLAGVWAGGLATLAYDLVRVPVAWAGVPVFKAIAYFGTVILGTTAPNLLSEIVGWAYHLSNGIGFALMYVSLVSRPRWWTAIAWGLALEGAMLITPYAEVFGYRMSGQSLAISIGGHVAFGLVLWMALRPWRFGTEAEAGPTVLRARRLLPGLVAVMVGLVGIAADFDRRHGRDLPPSPPPYLGPHLYTTWDVLEPDRLAALWVQRRFVDRQARFFFVPPFSHINHGTAFDTPEAGIRRSGTGSATEVLLAQHGVHLDDKLTVLAQMTHLYEVTPWRLQLDREAYRLGQGMLATVADCPRRETAACAERAFRFLDRWYETGGR
jgi:hypothetical protein